MSKGGGSSSPDTVTQNTSNLPEYAQPYYEDLLTRTAYESSIPYETYPERRLQPLGQQESEAITRFGELGTSGPTDDFRGAMYGASRMSTGLPYAANMLGATDWSQEALARRGAYRSGYDPGTITANYDPRGYTPGYEAGPMGGAGDYDPSLFDPDRLYDQQLLERYMSPYQQLVTDIEKREAMRASEIMGRDLGLEMAGKGSLGGYREAIMQAERQRNLERELSDIQSRGSQRAFESAQGALEADRAALFGAHQAYEQGLQQAAGLGLSQYEMGERARQAQEEFEFGAFQAEEAARQRAGEMGLDAQQIEEAARQAGEQFRVTGRAQDLSGIMGVAQLGQDAYSQLLAGEDRRLGALQTMGALDEQRQQMEIDRLMGMQAAGQVEREMLQRGLDIGYQDYLRQQAYPKEQLSFYNAMLRGLPITPGSVTASYGVGPSDTQQLLGAGIAGVGLYNAMRG